MSAKVFIQFFPFIQSKYEIIATDILKTNAKIDLSPEASFQVDIVHIVLLLTVFPHNFPTFSFFLVVQVFLLQIKR